METLYLERTRELKKNKKLIEKELNIKINIQGKKVTIKGNALNEYETQIILDAINFGFPVKTAILLKEEDFRFVKLNIKDFTRKKNLEGVRARLIGKHGKTKQTIEQISDCKIIINESQIGIIGSSEEIDITITGITNLVKGSKQTNVYRYLEKNKKNKKNC